jgi:hypothetical protein
MVFRTAGAIAMLLIGLESAGGAILPSSADLSAASLPASAGLSAASSGGRCQR